MASSSFIPSSGITDQSEAKVHSASEYSPLIIPQIPGPVVPQKVYSQEGFEPLPSIPFQEPSRAPQKGFRLCKALIPGYYLNIEGLHNEPLLRTYKGQVISLYISWPGMDGYYLGAPIMVRTLSDDVRKNNVQIVTDIALSVSQAMQGLSAVQCSEPAWNPANFDFDDIMLLELRHVAPQVWQPVVCWATPSGPSDERKVVEYIVDLLPELGRAESS